jgi:hypothetical protein
MNEAVDAGMRAIITTVERDAKVGLAARREKIAARMNRVAESASQRALRLLPKNCGKFEAAIATKVLLNAAACIALPVAESSDAERSRILRVLMTTGVQPTSLVRGSLSISPTVNPVNVSFHELQKASCLRVTEVFKLLLVEDHFGGGFRLLQGIVKLTTLFKRKRCL